MTAKTARANMSHSSNRVLTMDIIRGMAILFMTIYHQNLIFQPDGLSGSIAYFLGYLAAPFFLAVSGMVVLFHEEKHRWPFKMIIHGLVLFAMAWSMDVVYHRSFAIDWDIFQLIGSSYVLFGIFNYLGTTLKKYAALAVLTLTWALIADIRPDEGIFPIWPYGAFFGGGYVFIHYAKSRFNTRLNSVVLFLVACGYIIFWIAIKMIPSIVAVAGIIFALCLAFALTGIGLYVEKFNFLERIPFSFLIRFGTYPLSLYMGQQLVTRLGLGWGLYFKSTGLPVYDWIVQTALLIMFMFLATLVMDRLKFTSLEWWLRQIEYRLLKNLPPLRIFSGNAPASTARI